jgi:hypothetical protein
MLGPTINTVPLHYITLFSSYINLTIDGAIHGASKKFGEWYQRGGGGEGDANKLTILAFKMNPILNNTLLAPFIKAYGKCQERPI